MTTPVPAIVPTDPSRSRLWGVGSIVTTCLTAEESAGTLGITHFAAKAGERAAKHIHTLEDEIFMVRGGHVVVTAGDETSKIEGAGVVFLPRGIPHSYLVESDTADFFVITTPGGFERFFAEAGYPLDLGAAAPVGDRWSPARTQDFAEQLGLGLLWPN